MPVSGHGSEIVKRDSHAQVVTHFAKQRQALLEERRRSRKGDILLQDYLDNVRLDRRSTADEIRHWWYS
jgi:hypothetical protein